MDKAIWRNLPGHYIGPMKNLLRKNCAAFGAVALAMVIGLLFVSTGSAQARIDWQQLEKQLPERLVVTPDTDGFGYGFETRYEPATVPEAFLTGGNEAIKALKSGMAAGRIDTLVALTLLTQLHDRASADKLAGILTDRNKLARYTPRTARAIPFVLRYHYGDDKWPKTLIKALANSPTNADSSIVVCLTAFELPEADLAYWRSFPNLDSLSQRRIIQRITTKNKSDYVLLDFFVRSRIPSIQLMLVDWLEQRQSPIWPVYADSIARSAVGDAACRLLPLTSRTDTAIYRPLMRSAIAFATEKECIINAALTISADGDSGATEALRFRFHSNDNDLRVVSAIGLCRLDDRWGLAACIRLGLKNKRFRTQAIEALEGYTGLTYGEDDARWKEWLKANLER